MKMDCAEIARRKQLARAAGLRDFETYLKRSVADPSVPLDDYRHLHPDHLKDAPIDCLGTCDGLLFLRDCRGNIRAIRATRLYRAEIQSLFVVSKEWPRRLWPDGRGWSLEKAQETLIVACHRFGVVSPESLGVEVKWPRLAHGGQ